MVLYTTQSCNNFLDVTPDNIANLEHAFATKKEAERFLATLYSHAPDIGLVSNHLFIGADDAWTWYDNHYSYQSPWKIARGEQNTSNPYVNAWEGTNHMKNMFQGIRKCNIFIEEVSKTDKLLELDYYTRTRWLSEAKFLKAYYHFLLFRQYGPIPITDKNTHIDSSASEVRVKRNSVSEVVNYMDNLFMEAAAGLPTTIDLAQIEYGRVNKATAHAMRARMLTTAASPLFNGNPDYYGYTDKEGNLLFTQDYDRSLWERASKACEAALDSLPVGAELFKFREAASISNHTRTLLSYSGATNERANSEIIWGRPTSKSSSITIQHGMMPPKLDPKLKENYNSSYISVTLGMVERYYTINGVPIEEDKTWDYANRYNIVTTDNSQPYDLQENYKTAQLNVNRDPRFYASLAFDGSLFYLKSVPNGSDQNSFKVNSLYGQRNGVSGGREYTTVSGYFIKKLTNWNMALSDATITSEFYHWPEIRLTDLYLLAAECYNELDKRDLALFYIDEIRARSGLLPVKDAWTKYSTNPTKYQSKEGLGSIIRQEREIEMAYEGHRTWDLRRWKLAADYMNKNVMAWNVTGKKAEDYYRPTSLFEQRFITPRDYLWPISIKELQKNPNLQQNPGW